MAEEENPKLDGLWRLAGLPERFGVVFFYLTQEGGRLAGSLALDTETVEPDFDVTGHNRYPHVLLNFKTLKEWVESFTFDGQFTNPDTLTGALDGGFTGQATLKREQTDAEEASS